MSITYKPLLHSVTIFFCALMFASVVKSDDVVVHKNEDSGLLSWRVDRDGFSIELIQLLPDFVRAIYAKHNFPKKELDRIAGYCVFGTIIKNTSSGQLSYKVSDWRYSADEKTYTVKTKTQWLDEWLKAGIAFSWTLLPDSGIFEEGDWQQGFTTIQLPRNKKFDLTVVWEIKGNRFSNTLENIACSPETLSVE